MSTSTAQHDSTEVRASTSASSGVGELGLPRSDGDEYPEFDRLRRWFDAHARTPIVPWNRGACTAPDPASVDRLLTAADAANILTMLALYVHEAALIDGTWGVSCLPSYAGSGDQRAFTVSIGATEAAYATLDKAGRLTEWAVVINPANRERAHDLGFTVSQGSHGTFMHQRTVDEFLAALADDSLGRSVRTAVAESPYPGRTRFEARHNGRLLDLIFESLLDRLIDDPGADRSVESRYGAHMQRYRKHQRDFKRLLLEHYPHRCAACGFDNVSILEAAHVIPDADGGPSTIANGRLMCPNHHRAHDARLFRFDGDEVIWADQSIAFGRPAQL